MATITQTPQAPTWQTRVATKRARRDAAIPEAWKLHHVEPSTTPISDALFQYSGAILSQDDLDITNSYTAQQLLQKLAAGELTALAVTQAFSKRATVVHQLTNCLTETFFEMAMERAKFLDSYLQKEGKPFGPFHGLPISIKDTFQVQNVETTIGFVSFINNPPATVNSAMTQILLDLGAVLYVKTNIPQTLMTADSDNNIFGRVLNPYNTNLTAGGSSGGEGALVSLRGSCIGIGTDIAGSIRIPALCCGTYGFRPTTHRIPYGGQVSPAALGMPGIIPCAGPLANSMADIKLLMENVLGAKPWSYDSSAHAVPWRSEVLSSSLSTRPLTIGLLPEDPMYPLHPPIRRALDSAAARLAAAGHTIIPLPLTPSTSVSFASQLSFKFFAMDPNHTSIQHIQASGEPFVPSVSSTLALAAATGSGNPEYSLPELMGMNVQRAVYAEEWRKLWVGQKLDAVLSPGAQNTAVKHDTYGLPPYTVVWNCLDYPACIIPYQKASKELDGQPMEITPPAVGPNYNPDEVDGLPCAVQIVTPRFQDEECVTIATVVDAVLRG